MPIDPSFLRNTNAGINEQLMTAQQQLALAQALRGQSLQPIQAPGGQNGRISPLSVLAQALSGYAANSKMQGATHDLAGAQAAQAQNQMAVMARMLNPDQQPAPGGGDGGQSLSSMPQASTPGAVAAAPVAGAAAPQGGAGVPNPMGDSTWRQMAMAEQLGIMPAGTADAYAKARYTAATPTDQIKNDTWAGVTPQQRATLATGQNMKPNESRVQIGPDGKPINTLVAPDPSNNNQYTVGADGKVAAAPVPGVIANKSSLAGGEEGERENNKIITVTGPNGEQVPVKAGPAARAGGQQLGLTPPPVYTGHKLPDADLAHYRDLAAKGNTDAKMLVDAYDRAQPKLGVDPTVQTARGNQQTSMAEKWKPLNEAMSNAQTVNSRLDTIKDMATRASTGQFSDRIQFVNSLLSMAGSEKATSEATAKQLLDKNSNQIVAQLGQGGMATDAARAIIGAAYPSSHMTREAIAEAADNLKATNTMLVAKAGVLQQHYLKNDPAAYQQAESQFNAVADPRVFQWYSIHDPSQQAAFAKRAAAQDPAFRNKVQALVEMGALK